MKISLAENKNINSSKSKTPNFSGAVDQSFRFLATNQAVGANGVDFCFMVTPRTVSDTVKRGPNAGMETFRREIMGTVNDSLIGMFGAVSGALFALALNNKYGYKVNNILAAPETLDILAQNKHDQLKGGKSQVDYIKTTLENVKIYNPASARANNEGYVKISKNVVDEISNLLDSQLTNKISFKDWSNNKVSEFRNVLINKITEDTGAQSDYILESMDKKTVSKTNLKSLLNDMYIVSDSFNSEKIKQAFDDQIKLGKDVKHNVYMKQLNKFMKSRAAGGFAIASLIGLSVQPINMYLTKLKTGTDGFVGVEGRSKDTSNRFKVIKTGASAAFFSMILSTLGISPAKFITSPKTFMDKMAFTGKLPTINQLKGVYGVTIVSRIFSARDKDELREVLTKDTLGYLSWLVLGDIINKLAADSIDKSTLKYKKDDLDKNIFVRTFKSSLKTRDEVLIEALTKSGVKTTKNEGGKLVAKTFKEMLKDLDSISDNALKKVTKKQLRTLNIAQASGYIFSGLVLGLGIPNLNIYITNMLDKKNKAASKNQVA